MMHIPDQPSEHLDHWVQEAIDYLLEPDLDHPSTGKLFNEPPKEEIRSTKLSLDP